MREVRLLEADINTFQHELRTNIQDTQLKEYIEIGEEKLQEFIRDWDRKFADFTDESYVKL